MKQSRLMSLVESVANVLAGYGVAVLTQILIFPVFGLHTTLAQNLKMVERTFAWACINRRLARDFERFAHTARTIFQIAIIKLMTRRIARYRDF